MDWHRTEKLWQDVYTRSLSALFVAFVIYVFALLSGYVKPHPESRMTFILLVVLVAAVFAGTQREVRRGPAGIARLRRLDRYLWKATAIVALILFAVQLAFTLFH